MARQFKRRILTAHPFSTEQLPQQKRKCLLQWVLSALWPDDDWAGDNRNRNLILDFAQFVDEYTWLVVTWLASEALADVVITGTMCWLLLRKRTGFQR